MKNTLCTCCDHIVDTTVERNTKNMGELVLSAHQTLLNLFTKYQLELTHEGEFELAVNEALQNAFRHGKGTVTLCVGYEEDIDTICAAITDEGAGTKEGIITNSDIMPDLEAAHGRGFPIMNICAKVKCVKRHNKFTVYLTKAVKHATSDNAYGGNGIC